MSVDLARYHIFRAVWPGRMVRGHEPYLGTRKRPSSTRRPIESAGDMNHMEIDLLNKMGT